MGYKRNKKLARGFTRRQFMSLMGLAGVSYPLVHSPLRNFYGALVDGIVNKAQAQSSDETKALFFLTGGGPPRWGGDGFLTLNGNADNFVRNLSVNNRLTEDQYTGNNNNVEHTSVPITVGGRTVYLPPIWAETIPTFDGSFVPMASMLPNMLIMRGIDMEVDIGHQRGPALVTRPDPLYGSLSGIKADQTGHPLAVGMTNRSSSDPQNGAGFKSPAGRGLTYLANLGNNPLQSLLGSFQHTNGNVLANAGKIESMSTLVNDALTELANYVKAGKPGADRIYQDRNQAEQLLYTNFGNLQAQYNALVGKYAAIEQACRTPIPFMIPATGSAPYNINQFGGTNLAGQFAVAEFLITQNLSSSITIGMGNSVFLANGVPIGHPLAVFNDEHTQNDRQASVIAFNYQFRVIMAMIYELKRAVGAAQWDKMAVLFSAEYDRSPRNNPANAGSDHLPGGNTYTVCSGKIQSPQFLGNIYTDLIKAGDYLGTYGRGAPVSTNEGVRTLKKKDAAATVAAILGISPPVAAPSLVTQDGSGKVTGINTEDPKNVDT